MHYSLSVGFKFEVDLAFCQRQATLLTETFASLIKISFQHLVLNTKLSTIFLSLLCKHKDARSVSLYPYDRSQILQYVKYTK